MWVGWHRVGSQVHKASLFAWRAHDGPVTALSWDAHAHVLLTAGADASVKAWFIHASLFADL